MLKDIVQENVINIIVRLKLNISDVTAGLEPFFLSHPSGFRDCCADNDKLHCLAGLVQDSICN